MECGQGVDMECSQQNCRVHHTGHFSKKAPITTSELLNELLRKVVDASDAIQPIMGPLSAYYERDAEDSQYYNGQITVALEILNRVQSSLEREIQTIAAPYTFMEWRES